MLIFLQSYALMINSATLPHDWVVGEAGATSSLEAGPNSPVETGKRIV